MEHILQFAISIDDEAIKSRIEESALKQLSKDLSKETKNKIMDTWGSLQWKIEELIKECVNQYKDEILESAVRSVSDSIKRSKKYREALAQVTEEIKND